MKRRFVITLALCTSLMGGAVWADEPKPFEDFTFKRVGLPKKTASGVKRIIVQIDPAEQARALGLTKVAAPEAAAPEEAAGAPGADLPAAPKPTSTPYDWYWALISPGIEAAGAGRIAAAVDVLGKAPGGAGVPAPRLQDLQDIAEMHGTEILKATIGTKVSPALVLAVIGIESSGRSDALSSAGAEGLMQLMPDTASRFGVTDATDPVQNIKGGVAYLDWLMGEFDGDPLLALAGYNAGENAVKKHGGVPPFAETRAYVPKVMAAWSVARGLCLTPPMLASDGCVFTVKSAAQTGGRKNG